MKIGTPVGFQELPKRTHGKQEPRSELLRALRELPVNQKILVEIEETEDFGKNVNSISTKIKRKGALEGTYAVRSNKDTKTISIYRTA